LKLLSASPDFDSPAELAVPFFVDTIFGEDELILTTGAMPSLSFSNLVMSLNVPDGITSFTIRQIPVVVPEPSTALLLGLGLAGISSTRRGRTRR
jgi:hypothetical protein